MRAGLLPLLLLALLALSVFRAPSASAEILADDGELLIEEELDASGEQQPVETEEAPKMDPRLTVEAFDTILSKMTAKCRKEIEANPSDPTQVSERCRSEIGLKIQRYLARLDREEQKLQSGEPAEEPKPSKPRKKKMSKKQARAAREAAEARKKEEEYQQTLQVIIGFVATIIAVVVGATCFINRKLKAAGMYYPADPSAKASCCN